MLTPEQTAELEACRNYHTRYEVAMERNDGTKALLCYTPRKTVRGLKDAVSSRSKQVIAFLGADDKAMAIYNSKARQVVIIGLGWVSFTGRTQRDAILAGKLPTFEKVPA